VGAGNLRGGHPRRRRRRRANQQRDDQRGPDPSVGSPTRHGCDATPRVAHAHIDEIPGGASTAHAPGRSPVVSRSADPFPTMGGGDVAMRIRNSINSCLAMGVFAVAVGCSSSAGTAHNGGGGASATGTAGTGTAGAAGAGAAGAAGSGAAGTAGGAGTGQSGGAGGGAGSL